MGDTSQMAVVGRLLRVSKRVHDHLAKDLAHHGIDAALFDVMESLYRSGSPFRLSPKELTNRSVVSSSAIAQRLTRLETKGLIVRSSGDSTAPGTQAQLTERGCQVVDDLLPLRFSAQRDFLKVLTTDERTLLDALLTKLDVQE